MKRILYTTLVALLATLTPALAASEARFDGKVIELQLTKYGMDQNASGMAKITYAAKNETFGVAFTAKVPDGKEYLVAIVTKKGGAYKVAAVTTYLGTASVKLSQDQLPVEMGSVTNIATVLVLDDGGIVLQGNFEVTKF